MYIIIITTHYVITNINNQKEDHLQVKRIQQISDIPQDQRCEQFENLIIKGDILTKLFDEPVENNTPHDEELIEIFKNFIMKFRCVVFCRTTPNQKAKMVQMVRKEGKITLAIGDGANDVNMIQEAHVGVGIIGNEGKQAANTADFAISRFKDLDRFVIYILYDCCLIIY